MAFQQLADIIVPSVFGPYTQVLTEEKANIILSGAVVRDEAIDALLAGGGKTFDLPSWDDLDNDDDEVSTATAGESTPENIDSQQEVGVRLSRNKSWGSYDLLANLAGSDPLQAVENRVAFYWTRRLQVCLINTMRGVCRDNGVNDSGDYSLDVATASFVDGVTTFSAEHFNNGAQTMGDSSDDIRLLMVHSVVYTRMKNNNLIDFIPDSRNPDAQNIPTFLGAVVVQDDGMPSGTLATRGDGSDGNAGVYESWLFGPGAVRLGVGNPRVPVEIDRQPLQGNGGGRETLTTRREFLMHPSGHAYVGTGSGPGGPPNTAADDTTGALNRGASWNRVYPERKQIKFARVITRES